MDKKTLEALRGSIKKWSNIVKTMTAKDLGVLIVHYVLYLVVHFARDVQLD